MVIAANTAESGIESSLGRSRYFILSLPLSDLLDMQQRSCGTRDIGSTVPAGLYDDLPPYTRRSNFDQWYKARGSDVRIRLPPQDGWKKFLQCLKTYGSSNEAVAILAGYTIDPLHVHVTDMAILTEGKDTPWGTNPNRREQAEAIQTLLTRVNGYEQQSGYTLSKKGLVGNGHTHPGFDLDLSSRDTTYMMKGLNFARNHPGRYTCTGGNLELVVDPTITPMKWQFFKLVPGGYERC